jgi:hypothetical protein
MDPIGRCLKKDAPVPRFQRRFPPASLWKLVD